jgi:hypothetical protein
VADGDLSIVVEVPGPLPRLPTDGTVSDLGTDTALFSGGPAGGALLNGQLAVLVTLTQLVVADLFLTARPRRQITLTTKPKRQIELAAQARVDIALTATPR